MGYTREVAGTNSTSHTEWSRKRRLFQLLPVVIPLFRIYRLRNTSGYNNVFCWTGRVFHHGSIRVPPPRALFLCLLLRAASAFLLSVSLNSLLVLVGKDGLAIRPGHAISPHDRGEWMHMAISYAKALA